MNDRIVLLANNHKEAADWIKKNIVVITSPRDIDKIRDCDITSINLASNFFLWNHFETLMTLHKIYRR